MNLLIKEKELKMVGLGDVYLEKNKKGEVVLCIGIGNGKVSKKVIKNNKNGGAK